jgi:hypothetical protein
MKTVDDIANECGVDGQTVRTWIVSKQLAAMNVCKTAGGKKPRWRVRDEDLAAFLAGRSNRPATTQPGTTTKSRQKRVTTAKEWV